MRLKLILTATALCLAGPAAIAQELTGTLEKIQEHRDHRDRTS